MTSKQKTAEHEGPERLLDIMLRAGPYGDKFDGEGLTLAQLKQSPHGIDLGPLQPRLPELLATKNKRINIAPDMITADLTRLQAALDKGPGDHMLLIGRRHIRDMNSWLHNLNNYARGKNRCTLLINPQDAQRIGLSRGRYGEDYIEGRRIQGGSGDHRQHHARRGQPAPRLWPQLQGHAAIRRQQQNARYFRQRPGGRQRDGPALRHQRGEWRAGGSDACLTRR